MEKVASIIHISEITENTKIKYPHLEKKKYYPVIIKDDDVETVALFTEHELRKAVYRGNRNLEDVSRIEAMGRTEKFFKGL